MLEKNNDTIEVTLTKNKGLLRIGISGGTFDPIHFGHLIIAEDIREKLNLDKIIFIPSGNPPHKDSSRVTEAENRFDMVQEAIKTNPFFEVSRIEIDRGGYTYTVDTLQQLKTILGKDTQVFFIIGADVVFDLLLWRDYAKVFTLCEFVAALRPGYSDEKFTREIYTLKEKYGAVIHTVEAPLIDISSTAVRERIRNGKSVRYLVPEDVEKYLFENRLYREEMPLKL